MRVQKNNYLKISILLSIYYILLFWVYKNLIAPRWSYRGFVNEYSEDNFYLSILGTTFTIITYIIYDKSIKPSAIVMNLFNLIFYIPMYIFVAFKNTVDGFVLFLFLYQFLFFLFYQIIPFNFRPLIKRNKSAFFIITYFIMISSLLINIRYNGFEIKIDLSDVYENRLAKREMSIPSIFNYIKAASYFVGIILLMYFLKIKKYSLVIAIILIQLMSFAFGASKTQFFSIFVCLIGFYFYTDKLKLWAPVSLIIITFLSILEFKFLYTTNITDIGIRRTLFVPSKISYNMFEFFEDGGREFLYLRGSILRFLGFEDPYAAQGGFQRMIGVLYGGSEDTNANTGLLGNDYAQFGWFSAIFFTFIRVYLLRLYDYCARGIDNRILAVLSIFIAFTYISGAFFTVLITNGILLTLYLLYNYPRDKKN